MNPFCAWHPATISGHHKILIRAVNGPRATLTPPRMGCIERRRGAILIRSHFPVKFPMQSVPLYATRERNAQFGRTMPLFGLPNHTLCGNPS